MHMLNHLFLSASYETKLYGIHWQKNSDENIKKAKWNTDKSKNRGILYHPGQIEICHWMLPSLSSFEKMRSSMENRKLSPCE